MPAPTWVNTGVWPGTYAEALVREQELGQEYSKIEAQLATRKPTETLPWDEYAEYLTWRRSALGAKEFIRRERDALRLWMKPNTPVNGPLPSGNLKTVLAAKLGALEIDYTVDQLENLRRRVGAEAAIGRYQILIAELVEMFGEHEPCGDGCTACYLLARAEQEAR